MFTGICTPQQPSLPAPLSLRVPATVKYRRIVHTQALLPIIYLVHGDTWGRQDRRFAVAHPLWLFLFALLKGKTMLTVESATNPVYSTSDGVCIVLQVKFAEFEEVMPFGATPHDTMPYGVELYNRAVAGEFGEIAPYDGPENAIQPTTEGAQTL